MIIYNLKAFHAVCDSCHGHDGRHICYGRHGRHDRHGRHGCDGWDVRNGWRGREQLDFDLIEIHSNLGSMYILKRVKIF